MGELHADSKMHIDTAWLHAPRAAGGDAGSELPSALGALLCSTAPGAKGAMPARASNAHVSGLARCSARSNAVQSGQATAHAGQGTAGSAHAAPVPHLGGVGKGRAPVQRLHVGAGLRVALREAREGGIQQVRVLLGQGRQALPLEALPHVCGGVVGGARLGLCHTGALPAGNYVAGAGRGLLPGPLAWSLASRR